MLSLAPSNFEQSLDESLEKKQSLVSAAALTLALILFAYVSITYLVSPVRAIGREIATIAAVLFLIIHRLSRNPKYYTLCAAAIVSITMAGGFVASIGNDGLFGHVVPILIIVPMMAGLFLGARATVYATIATVISYVTLLFLDTAGWVKHAPFAAEHLPLITLMWMSTTTIIGAASIWHFARDSEIKIQSLTDLKDKLHHAALHDTLTGISNRQGLQQYLQGIRRSEQQIEDKISVIHIDLDKFKAINDTHGHPVGDGVLYQAAQIMKNHCGSKDKLARIGGDEFVIVRICQSSVTSDDIQTFCEELIAKLKRPMAVNGISCRIGASAGFVIADLSSSSLVSLIANADAALYEAKHGGRGMVCQFQPKHRDTGELALSGHGDDDLDEDSISVVLQPQICIKTGKIVGVESLGRMLSADGEIMMPAEFLPILEASDKIVEFDLEIASKSLDALLALQANGVDVPNVSINASAHTLRSPRYAYKLHRKLKSRNMEPACLIVEVLETTSLEDDEFALRTISQLRGYSIRTVIDDFGSGHASYGSLLRSDLDGLKIDRSLVRDIDNKKSRKIVQSILHLSEGLGLPAIVEGVETPHQHAVLRSLGCQTVQGFGICRPLAVDNLIEWAKSYGKVGASEFQERVRSTYTS